MLEARLRVEAGEPTLPFVVVADTQTTGIGRRGRPWISDHEAGLYATFASNLVIPPEQIGMIAITTGVAIAESLAETGVDPRLKWPNDILIEDRKLGGILIQSFGPDPRTFLIGIGINLEPSATLDEAGGIALNALLDTPMERKRLVRMLARSIGTWMDILATRDTDTIIDTWVGYSLFLGQEVAIVTDSETIRGTQTGIDHTGRLILATTDGERRFAAGDVSVGPRA